MTENTRTVDSIVAALDEHVVGQHRAKEVLAAAAVMMREGLGAHEGRPIPLLVGRSGTGKTLLVKTLAERVLRVPWATIDSSQITPDGYVGIQASSVVDGLVSDPRFNSAAPLAGICLVDELCKLAGETGAGSQFRRHAETSLLKILEGAPVQRSGGPFARAPVSRSTKSVLFVCAGSFHDARVRVEARRSRATLGFGAGSAERAGAPIGLAEIRAESGILPEILARLTSFALCEDAQLSSLISAARRNTTLRAFADATRRRRGVELAFGASWFRAWAEAAAASPEGGFRSLALELNGVMSGLLRRRESWTAADGRVVLTGSDFEALRAWGVET